MIRTSAALAFGLIALLGSGCDGGVAQDEFELDAAQTPSGIFRTLDGTTALNGDDDPDDWRIAPIYATSAFVSARAFPNPALLTDQVVILITSISFDAGFGELRAVGFTETGRRVVLDVVQGANGEGTFTIAFPAALLVDARPGIRRIFVFDARSRLVTYGDLLVQ